MHVKMIQPFTHKDFAIRSLADRIKDLSQCVYLYPDIPKDKAFGSYYTPMGGECAQLPLPFQCLDNAFVRICVLFFCSEPANNGYVKPELKVVVGDDTNGMQSYPNTPQRSWQSPDHIREPPSVSRYVFVCVG